MSTPLRVGVLAYPGCFASEIFGVVDLLTMAGHIARAHEPGATPFETAVVSPRRRVLASGGVALGVRPMQPVDVLVVPGFELVPGEDLDRRLSGLGPEVDQIKGRDRWGTTVVSICVGAFLVGEAGLLDHRHATTSWLFSDQLAERHPAATVTADELVVSDSGVTTTAAFSAMFDFVVDLVEAHCGRRIARQTARVALVDDVRSSQAAYVDQALLPAPGSTFGNQVQRYLDQHLAQPYSLPELAERFHVSTRTLLRRYKADTGESPLTYLQRARVRRARHLLEHTDRGLGEIHNAVGYRDPSAFTALFNRQVGVRPPSTDRGSSRADSASIAGVSSFGSRVLAPR